MTNDYPCTHQQNLKTFMLASLSTPLIYIVFNSKAKLSKLKIQLNILLGSQIYYLIRIPGVIYVQLCCNL
jgi:hypothetical protein